MDTEIHIGIGIVMYIVYNVVLNWMYIKEYTNKGTVKDCLTVQKGNGVIKRGNEWPD
jgi:hypothetical protein